MTDWLLKETDLGGVEGSNGGIDTQISDVTSGSSRYARKVGVLLVSLHSVMTGYDWLWLAKVGVPCGGGHVELRAWDFQEALIRWATKHLPC